MYVVAHTSIPEERVSKVQFMPHFCVPVFRVAGRDDYKTNLGANREYFSVFRKEL
jgi:hypothetical protein